jgi:PTH1 family peptidyl-tRNA hydrolase
VVERVAERLGARFRKVRFLAIEVAEARSEDAVLFLARPLTFMNVSGPPLASFARKRGIPVERVVACHDEIDLSFGALKLKQGGATAGHHGLDSMAEAFRGPGFFRVRLGVGHPRGRKDPADYVLEPFAKAEREEAELLVEDGADAVLALVTEGLGAAQDRYNRSGPRP